MRCAVTMAFAMALTLSGCAAPSLAVLLAPTSTPTAVPTAEPCKVQAAPFLAELVPLTAAWDDASKLAQITSRVALSPVIAQLQELRRDVAQMEPPQCAAQAHRLLVEAMDTQIDAYLAFMAKESDREVSELFALAAETLDAATAALYEVRTGEPMPTPTPLPAIVAQREATKVLEAAGLSVIDCKIVRSWSGQTLSARVAGISVDADDAALRPAMDASSAILVDETLEGFVLHLLDEDNRVARSLWVRRSHVAEYSRGTLLFEDFAAKWQRS